MHLALPTSHLQLQWVTAAYCAVSNRYGVHSICCLACGHVCVGFGLRASSWQLQTAWLASVMSKTFTNARTYQHMQCNHCMDRQHAESAMRICLRVHAYGTSHTLHSCMQMHTAAYATTFPHHKHCLRALVLDILSRHKQAIN